MRKSTIMFIAVALSLLCFIVLGRVFKGVSHTLANKLYQPDYLRPSPVDSAYMSLLQDMGTRATAMSLSDSIRPFYITADSIRGILRAELSAELLSDIIISKGFASDMRQHLLRLDTLLACSPPCLDSAFAENEQAWLHHFRESDKDSLTVFVETYIQQVERGELHALRRMLRNR